MKLTLTLAIGLLLTSPSEPAAQSQSAGRDQTKAEILITTLPAAEVKAASTLEHDTEVGRDEAITVVVMLPSCQKDAQGACNASADIVAYKPNGDVHSEMKRVSRKAGRGTASLQLAPADATGVYKVVATVQDLDARRFGRAERLFGVK